MLNSDKPKLSENPNAILNFKEHHVTSHSRRGSSVYSHCSESEGLFQRLPLSRAIEQPLTFESSGEVTPASLHCYLPLEGVSSQVSGSTSCDLKRKSQPDDAFDVFDRYSQLCMRNVLPRRSSSSPHLPTSSNVVGTNNDISAQTICNDSLNMAFVQNEIVRLGSNERDLERVLLKPRHVRDDRYGCLFQQSGSVETQGQSSGSVHVGFPASWPSKRSHSDLLQGTLPSEGSPLKRSHSSTSTVKNRRTTRFRHDIAGHDTSGHVGGISYVYDDLGDCDQQCYHCGATFWFGECLKGQLNSRRPVYHLCCGGGGIYMDLTPDPPEYIKNLHQNKHFMENIRAYNQMFAMTSFGAKIDESINNGRGPYVFKVSGQMWEAVSAVRRLYDVISRGERDGYEVGGRIILLMSFTGGSRYMYAHYLDALAIFQKLELTTADRPDIVCRVFEQKIHSFLDFLKREKIFGAVTGVLYTVEFQKRSLPHCHTLFLIDSESKIQGPEDVDRLISAELPDPQTDPQGYKVVSEMMIHGPCGNLNYNATLLWVEYADKISFQYISKGTDRIFARVSRPLGESSNAAGPSRPPIDEIQNYLEGQFRITFRDKDKLESVVNLPGRKNTTMTEWLAYNEANEDGRNLTYLDFPSEFIWYDDGKSWSPRRNSKSAIGRLAYVHPTSGTGLEDNNEWDIAMQEACVSAMSSQLRFVFAHILTHCEVTDPLKLWTKYWKEMSRTAHSRFKLPIELTEASLCKVTKNSQLGKLLADTDLIIWDEAPMNDRHCFESLDRSLRDILTMPRCLFGGKSILLGGDFHQTLPVKKGASKMEIIASRISHSDLLPHFKVFTHNENMRLSRHGVSAEERNLIRSFSSWLLDIGDGRTGEPDQEDLENSNWIDIPLTYYLPDDEQGLSKLIDFIYDEMTLRTPSAITLQEKAIVCPKNKTADMINSKVLEMVQGETTTYLSHDEAIPLERDGADTEMLYPVEHLNTLKFPGFPPHRLELKIGAPVTLLRNVNVDGGLCNGTRMTVRQMMKKLIEVQIITGNRVGENVFIHRISLNHKDSNFPFIFKRRKFPIKLCYAMTINKIQGQSLSKIGVFLPEPIFGYGQLYVALSRATTPHGLKILIQSQENRIPTATKNIVYRDFLQNIPTTPPL
ncbi:DNA helicase [Tanacetum coccineum]